MMLLCTFKVKDEKNEHETGAEVVHLKKTGMFSQVHGHPEEARGQEQGGAREDSRGHERAHTRPTSLAQRRDNSTELRQPRLAKTRQKQAMFPKLKYDTNGNEKENVAAKITSAPTHVIAWMHTQPSRF